MKTRLNWLISVRRFFGIIAGVLFTSLVALGSLAAGEFEFTGGAIRTAGAHQKVTDNHPDGKGVKTAEVPSRFPGLPVPQQWQRIRHTAFVRKDVPVRSSVVRSQRNPDGLQTSADSEWEPRAEDLRRSRDSRRYSENTRLTDWGRENLLSTRQFDRLTDGRDLNQLSGTSYFPSSRSRRSPVNIGDNARDSGYLDRESVRDVSSSYGNCPNGNCSRSTGYRGYPSGGGLVNPACPNGRCGTGSCPNGNCSPENCATGNCATGTCQNGRCGTPAPRMNPIFGLGGNAWGPGGTLGMRRGPAMPSRR